jgi:hypothetical protein
MNPIMKNIIAIIAGLILGSVVNMGIIMVSSSIIPPPEGADVTTMEGLKQSMHLFQPRHFITPFLAHALGTFAGAYLTAKIAATHKMKLALLVSVFFLVGGITNIFMLPSPTWFSVLDLIVAYIPMGFLGGKLALLRKSQII